MDVTSAMRFSHFLAYQATQCGQAAFLLKDMRGDDFIDAKSFVALVSNGIVPPDTEIVVDGYLELRRSGSANSLKRAWKAWQKQAGIPDAPMVQQQRIVSFVDDVVFVPVIWGTKECEATSAQLARLSRDPDAVYAELLGFPSAALYMEWYESMGALQCIGKTAKGKQCKISAKGMSLLSHDEWLKLRDAGGYCGLHGG